MGPGMLAVWLKVIAPASWTGWQSKVFLEPAIRRAMAARQTMEQEPLEAVDYVRTTIQDLSGVAETSLITLYLRAMESQRPTP